jgi:hypothetical protein
MDCTFIHPESIVSVPISIPSLLLACPQKIRPWHEVRLRVPETELPRIAISEGAIWLPYTQRFGDFISSSRFCTQRHIEPMFEYLEALTDFVCPFAEWEHLLPIISLSSPLEPCVIIHTDPPICASLEHICKCTLDLRDHILSHRRSPMLLKCSSRDSACEDCSADRR